MNESQRKGQSIAEYEPDGKAAWGFADLATALEGRLSASEMGRGDGG